MKPYDAYHLAVDKPNEFKMNKDYYEIVISNDSFYSYRYARDVLRGRFELGEKEIAAQCGHSYFYAKEVLNDRFELGEYGIDKYLIRKYLRRFYNKTSLQYKFI